MKNLIALIGKMKPKGSKEDDSEDFDNSESDQDVGLQSAFDDLVAALKAHDSEAGVVALKSFIEQCKEDYSEDSEEDSDF